MNIKYLTILIFIMACQPGTPPPDSTQQPPSPELVNMKAHDTIKVDTSISLDYLLGKFDPTKDERFVLIDERYSDRADRLLRKEAYDAFVAMQTSATKEDIVFKVISATRNFDYQKGIWERKWNGKTKVEGQDLSAEIADPRQRALKILEYSSMPGTSRHHWGTDLDLNSFNNAYFETGNGLKEYDWLRQHAAEYGFCQPYNAMGADRPNGYQEERWHWSFMPLSRSYTVQAKLRIKNEMIEGFAGAKQAAIINVVDNYILGINPACLK